MFRQAYLERLSIDRLRVLASQENSDPQLHLLLGRKLFEAKRLPEAVEVLGDGLRRLQVRDDLALRAQLDGYLGLTLVTLGQDRVAVPYFKRALELDPGNVAAHLAFGWALEHRKQHELAATEFGIVTRLEPRHAPGWHGLGIARLGQRKFPEAEAALRQAIRLAPKRPEYRMALGEAFALQSRFDEAEQQFAEAARLSPESREARGALARARTLKATTPEEYRRARKELEPFIDESNPTFLGHLGLMDAQFGDLKQAEANLERAVALDPANPEINYALAMVYRRQGRHAEAEATQRRFRRMEALYRRTVQLRKRLSNEPNNRAMHLELARCLEERGEYGEAINHYRYILRAFPNEKQARERLRALLRKFENVLGPIPEAAP